MKKRFLASGAMIAAGAAIALSSAFYNSNPWSIYSMDNDPSWKQARNADNYWAMVRKYNR